MTLTLWKNWDKSLCFEIFIWQPLVWGIHYSAPSLPSFPGSVGWGRWKCRFNCSFYAERERERKRERTLFCKTVNLSYYFVSGKNCVKLLTSPIKNHSRRLNWKVFAALLQMQNNILKKIYVANKSQLWVTEKFSGSSSLYSSLIFPVLRFSRTDSCLPQICKDRFLVKSDLQGQIPVYLAFTQLLNQKFTNKGQSYIGFSPGSQHVSCHCFCSI